jgi:MoxR-like ATPase
MPRDITKLLHDVGMSANRVPRHQVSTLAHVLLHCLQNHRAAVREGTQGPVRDAIAEIEANVRQYAPLSDENRGSAASSRKIFSDYVPSAAAQDYASFYAARQEPDTQADAVLWWLLEGELQDKWLVLCRKVCRRHHVDALYLFQDDAEGRVPELGFGIEIDAEVPVAPLAGRQADLERHLGFLSLAVKQRRHYLLEGQQGVGKSIFVRKLLAHASHTWRRAADPVLRGARFLYFSHDDFIGSVDHNRMRLEKLYDHLRHHPMMMPVFDSLEAILNPHLSIHEAFSELFGASLGAGGRTFVLVSRSGRDAQSSLLRHIKSVNLPPLSPAVTREIVRDRLELLIAQAELPLEIESPQEFYSQLVGVASERYPGRFFPEIALHLADSVLNRAENRVYYLQQEPLDMVTLRDLWEHVAEEQSLHVELLGKDPDEFYQGVQVRLKQQLIAQDHAVDQVCGVLRLMAKRPPRRAPRGRFLFAGPPGVGKTHLGRQLAIQLGLGEEAFFVFNMSEYASEGARTRFMGADPGYVGFRGTKTIYDMVRSRPSCVILLDEIDRADASVQDILLSILEGEGKDAEGETVYFSQVIFIMTTNQGQDQVIEAHRDVERHGIDRDQLVRRFSDEVLRSLVLQGVVDEVEADMKRLLRAETDSVKAAFAISQRDGSAAREEGERLVEHYIFLRQKTARLEQVQRKTPLDRALLDRIDFVIPFFPIKEPEHLERILDLSLERYEWGDCPAEIRRSIVEHALAEDESVRSIERLVIKHLERSHRPSPQV